MSAEQDFDLDAAGLRLDGADIETSVAALASKLEDALPAATRVERKRARPLSKDQRVREIEVRLGGCRYCLRIQDGGVAAFREREVGGISIKREPLAAQAWVAALAGELHEQAQVSEQARLALAILLA